MIKNKKIKLRKTSYVFGLGALSLVPVVATTSMSTNDNSYKKYLDLSGSNYSQLSIKPIGDVDPWASSLWKPSRYGGTKPFINNKNEYVTSFELKGIKDWKSLFSNPGSFFDRAIDRSDYVLSLNTLKMSLELPTPYSNIGTSTLDGEIKIKGDIVLTKKKWG